MCVDVITVSVIDAMFVFVATHKYSAAATVRLAGPVCHLMSVLGYFDSHFMEFIVQTWRRCV